MRSRPITVVLVVAALLTTAGCAGIIPGDDTSGDAGPALNYVPAQATGVSYIDVDGLLSSDAHRQLVNTYLSGLANQSESYTGPTSLDDALAEAENESGLALTSIDAVTAFSSSSGASDYSGAIFTGSFSESEFVSAQEQSQPYNYSQTTYAGHTLYEPTSAPLTAEGSYIGVLEDGTFVTGTESAVKDVLDVSAGNADAISGDVQEAFENSRDGFVRFAATVPEDQLPTDAANRSVPFDATVYSSVTTVWGAHYVADETVGVTVTMQATSADAATDVRDVTDGAISLASGYVSNETAKDQLRAITVEQAGDVVTVTYENSVSSLDSIIEMVFARLGMTA